jgi:hypothetical protein
MQGNFLVAGSMDDFHAELIPHAQPQQEPVSAALAMPGVGCSGTQEVVGAAQCNLQLCSRVTCSI